MGCVWVVYGRSASRVKCSEAGQDPSGLEELGARAQRLGKDIG